MFQMLVLIQQFTALGLPEVVLLENTDWNRLIMIADNNMSVSPVLDCEVGGGVSWPDTETLLSPPHRGARGGPWRHVSLRDFFLSGL